MIRKIIIVVLFGLFSLPFFPTLAAAQNRQSGQSEENVKNVASLTTTDLLNAQDFAPQVKESPAQRSRFANVAKGKKGMVSPRVSELDEEPGKAGLPTGTVATLANVMQPTTIPARERIEAAPNPSSVPLTTTTGNQSLDELITQSARRNGVDQRLMLAVMKQESSFNPRATSYKGARGLMQLMPATAIRFGVTDIYDPAQNIEGGARYLRFLLDTFQGDVELTLAGYNAGENAVIRYGYRIPPYRETQDYVRKISAHYARLTNGSAATRPVTAPARSSQKKPESELITVGQTMTQY